MNSLCRTSLGMGVLISTIIAASGCAAKGSAGDGIDVSSWPVITHAQQAPAKDLVSWFSENTSRPTPVGIVDGNGIIRWLCDDLNPAMGIVEKRRYRNYAFVMIRINPEQTPGMSANLLNVVVVDVKRRRFMTRIIARS